MDWYAWLRKAGLGADLALEYALLFARNDLGAADVRHLDHDLLATMGVAVAKHRLDIIKLARKEQEDTSSSSIAVLPWRATRLLAAAVHRSALSLAAHLRRSVARRRGSAAATAAVAPRPLCYRTGMAAAPAQWKAGTAMRGGKLALLRHVSKPMLANYSRATRRKAGTTTPANKAAPAAAAAIAACFVSPETCSYNDDDDDGEEDDGGEDMPWESMFQDLKPT